MYVFAACIHAFLYFTEYVRSIYGTSNYVLFSVLRTEPIETLTEYVRCLGSRPLKLIAHYYVYTHYWPSHVEGI
jgi:hypothetical protein